MLQYPQCSVDYDVDRNNNDELDRGVDRVKPWFVGHGLAHGS